MKIIHTEVLVVGGGTAGTVAALAAAEEGASVLLVEREAVLGGLSLDVHGYHYGVETGMVRRLDAQVERLTKNLGWGEAYRTVLARALDEKKVKVITGRPTAVFKDAEVVRGFRVVTPVNRLAIFADVTVDSTGDATAAVMAGAPYIMGRDWDRVSNTSTLGARTEGGDLRVEDWLESHDPRDLTRVILNGQERLFAKAGEQDKRITSFYRHLGVRAGRYICGEYTVTLEDLIRGKTFVDGVLWSYSNYDPHNLDYAHLGELAQFWVVVMGLWGLPVYCQIPFRSFIPQRLKGILIASRAISVTPEAGMAIRMLRDVKVMGEIAGTAAALCVKKGCRPDTLPWELLRRRLNRREIRSGPEALYNLRTSKKGYYRSVRVKPERIEGVGPEALNLLATAEEDRAMAWWEMEEDYRELLGTPGEGKALYEIYRRGLGECEALLAFYREARGAKKRGAAFGLALLGLDTGSEELIDAVRFRDGDIPAGRRQLPRWMAAVVLLRILKSKRAFEVVLECVSPDPEVRPWGERDSLGQSYWEKPSFSLVNLKINGILFALRYFHELIGELDEKQKKALRERLHVLLDHCPGRDFMMFDGSILSFKWGVELSAAGLLARCGEERGVAILSDYLKDERAFVRSAAERRWKEAGL